MYKLQYLRRNSRLATFFSSDWEAVVKLSDDFNGADLRNVCTEAGEDRTTLAEPHWRWTFAADAVHWSVSKTLFLTGMFAIRAERDYVVDEDFMKAVRKVADNKKLESKLDYKPV